MTHLEAIHRKGGQPGPLLCLEVNPPRGVDVEQIFKRLEGKVGAVDFFNVTDSALARMKLAAFPFAALLKQRFGIEPLVNVTCRDRNLIALQADLLGGWASGVRSIVALTGDAVSVGDSPDRKAVFEVNSLGLLHAVSTLNGGRDLAGNELKGSPGFLPGVVVNPNARNVSSELSRLRKKKEAGALFALSQPVFDESSSREFFTQAAQVGLPIFMGLMAFKNRHAVDAVTRVPGIRISESFKALVDKAPEQRLPEISIEHCLKLGRLNSASVRGFHVVTGANTALALELTTALADLVRNLKAQSV